jgi:hypothetical protein
MSRPHPLDQELLKRSITHAFHLLRRGHNLGTAIDITRREIVNLERYPASYARIREYVAPCRWEGGPSLADILAKLADADPLPD